MKTVLFVLCLFCGLSIQAQELAFKAAPAAVTVANKSFLAWEKTAPDFGQIPKYVPAKAEFVVTNTSDKPMLLTNVKGSCGCTATGYSKEPIPAGESTVITATYNAKRVGKFTKSVTVSTNLDNQPAILKIKGEVTK